MQDLILKDYAEILRVLKEDSGTWLQQQHGDIFIASSDGWINVDQDTIMKVISCNDFDIIEQFNVVTLNGIQTSKNHKKIMWKLRR